jgi:hypothetical protein
MLGISSGLMYGGGPLCTTALVYSYESDFTSNADGWVEDSVQGNLTLSFNQDIPGGSGGGWMKGVYDTEQTNASGIIKEDVYTSVSASEYSVVTFKLYIDSENWPAVSHIGMSFYGVSGAVQTGLNHPDVPVDQEFNVTLNDAGPYLATLEDLIFSFMVGNNHPLADAEWYIKDIDVKIYLCA